MPKKIFLIAGEKSGDVHAAELLSALEKEGDYHFFGLGGRDLAQYGEFEDWVEEAAVIGLTEVLLKYGWFRKKFRETLNTILAQNPAAVILVDYPGFNLRIAKQLRKRGYQGKICYYISPQVWAWNKRRIPKMAAWLDLMLCVFPFEKELYEQSGLLTEWVGHPLVEELEERRIVTQRSPRVMGLFPGSRSREVKALLPMMLESAALFLAQNDDWRVEIAVASERIVPLVEKIVKESSLSKSTVLRQEVGTSHALMQTATLGVIASGTATLEAAYYGLPYTLIYRVSPLTYELAKRLVKIELIGMANILAGREVVKELVQGEVTPAAIHAELDRLKDPEVREATQRALKEVAAKLGGGGAHQKAARAIAQQVEKGEEGSTFVK